MLCGIVCLVPKQSSPCRPLQERISYIICSVPEGHSDFVGGESMSVVYFLIVSHIHVAAFCIAVFCQDGLAICFDFDTGAKQEFMYSVGIARKILVSRLNIIEQFLHIFEKQCKCT